MCLRWVPATAPWRNPSCRPVGGWPLGWRRCFTTSLQTTSLAGSHHLTTPLTGTTGLEIGCSPSRRDAILGVQRVQTEGLRAFRNVVGCILCNELIDNFPVHRFAIQGGRVKEVFVTSAGGNLTEVLDEPSSPRIEERLTSLGLFPLPPVPSRRVSRRGELGHGGLDWPACPSPRPRVYSDDRLRSTGH